MEVVREQIWTLDHLFGRIFTKIGFYLIENLQRPLQRNFLAVGAVEST